MLALAGVAYEGAGTLMVVAFLYNFSHRTPFVERMTGGLISSLALLLVLLSVFLYYCIYAVTSSVEMFPTFSKSHSSLVLWLPFWNLGKHLLDYNVNVMYSRGYHGVGPTIDDAYLEKSKILPDPVPRSEMKH